jgi:hypothetical protein
LPSIFAHLIFNQSLSSSCGIAVARMQKRLVRHGLTRLGELAAHPAAFGVIAIYAAAWLLFSPRTFGWSAIASLVPIDKCISLFLWWLVAMKDRAVGAALFWSV